MKAHEVLASAAVAAPYSDLEAGAAAVVKAEAVLEQVRVVKVKVLDERREAL